MTATLPHVPILGQPCKVLSHYSTVLIQCNCAAQTPLVLVMNLKKTCPACGSVFVVGDQGKPMIGLVTAGGGGLMSISHSRRAGSQGA